MAMKIGQGNAKKIYLNRANLSTHCCVYLLRSKLYVYCKTSIRIKGENRLQYEDVSTISFYNLCVLPAACVLSARICTNYHT